MREDGILSISNSDLGESEVQVVHESDLVKLVQGQYIYSEPFSEVVDMGLTEPDYQELVDILPVFLYQNQDNQNVLYETVENFYNYLVTAKMENVISDNNGTLCFFDTKLPEMKNIDKVLDEVLLSVQKNDGADEENEMSPQENQIVNEENEIAVEKKEVIVDDQMTEGLLEINPNEAQSDCSDFEISKEFEIQLNFSDSSTHKEFLKNFIEVEKELEHETEKETQNEAQKKDLNNFEAKPVSLYITDKNLAKLRSDGSGSSSISTSSVQSVSNSIKKIRERKNIPLSKVSGLDSFIKKSCIYSWTNGQTEIKLVSDPLFGIIDTKTANNRSIIEVISTNDQNSSLETKCFFVLTDENLAFDIPEDSFENPVMFDGNPLPIYPTQRVTFSLSTKGNPVDKPIINIIGNSIDISGNSYEYVSTQALINRVDNICKNPKSQFNWLPFLKELPDSVNLNEKKHVIGVYDFKTKEKMYYEICYEKPHAEHPLPTIFRESLEYGTDHKSDRSVTVPLIAPLNYARCKRGAGHFQWTDAILTEKSIFKCTAPPIDEVISHMLMDMEKKQFTLIQENIIYIFQRQVVDQTGKSYIASTKIICAQVEQNMMDKKVKPKETTPWFFLSLIEHRMRNIVNNFEHSIDYQTPRTDSILHPEEVFERAFDVLETYSINIEVAIQTIRTINQNNQLSDGFHTELNKFQNKTSTHVKNMAELAHKHARSFETALKNSQVSFSSSDQLNQQKKNFEETKNFCTTGINKLENIKQTYTNYCEAKAKFSQYEKTPLNSQEKKDLDDKATKKRENLKNKINNARNNFKKRVKQYRNWKNTKPNSVNFSSVNQIVKLEDAKIELLNCLEVAEKEFESTQRQEEKYKTVDMIELQNQVNKFSDLETIEKRQKHDEFKSSYDMISKENFNSNITNITMLEKQIVNQCGIRNYDDLTKTVLDLTSKSQKPEIVISQNMSTSQKSYSAIEEYQKFIQKEN
jgi:hypothetical protein